VQQERVKPEKATESAASSRVKKVSDRVQELGDQAAGAAAKVEKTAEEISEEFNQTVENDIIPVAERAGKAVSEAGKKVSEAGKKVRTQVDSAAKRARKSVTETSKKVREEVAPRAEKAGKGISDVLKATARATRKSARILGIKASIAAELRKRQRLYSMLGETYFRVQKKKTPSQGDQDALKSLVSDIEKVEATIKSLELKEKTTRSTG
jgi:hypothetical protein